MKIYTKDLVVCDQSSSTMYYDDCDEDGINFDPDDPDFEPSCQVKSSKKIPLPDFNANHSRLRSSLETRYSNVEVLSNKYLNNGGGITGKLRKRTPPVLIPTLNRNLSTGILDNRPVFSTQEVNMRQAEVENHENNCSSPNSWYSERGVLTLEDIRNQHHNNHNMLTLEELKSHYSSCFTCGVSWNEDHVSLDCFECGGYSMQRPCPICEGKCHRTWNRDVAMSHAMHKAHWEGECGLPARDQEAFIIKTLVEASEECITEALKDLKTSS